MITCGTTCRAWRASWACRSGTTASRASTRSAASRAYLWLKGRDPALAKRFAQAVYAKLWAEGVDITPAETVADVAAPLGIDRAELLAAVASGPVKELLKQAVDEAVGKGVFGVPFFIADGEPIWGGDRLWMLEHWLRHGSWDPGEALQTR